MQKNSYLLQLNVSPTSISTVVETLNMSKLIAEECEQKYISVTFDLAIANIALTIKSEERPEFDNLFVQLGSFHIELSFFKAIGKCNSDSGGPYILRESSALAELGSLDAFYPRNITTDVKEYILFLQQLYVNFISINFWKPWTTPPLKITRE
jgi:hypothetical protein